MLKNSYVGCCHWSGLTVQNSLYYGSILHLNSHLDIPRAAVKCSVWKCGTQRDVEGDSPGMMGGTVHKAVCAAIVSALSAVQCSCFWQTDGGVSKKGISIFSFCKIISGQFGELFY